MDASVPWLKTSGPKVQGKSAALLAARAAEPSRSVPLTCSKRPTMYTREPSGLTAMPSIWRDWTLARNERRLPVVESNEATRGRDSPPTVLKLPAMNTALRDTAMPRTWPFEPAVNVESVPPLPALSAPKRLREFPLRRLKLPPTYTRLPSGEAASAYTGPLAVGAQDVRSSPVRMSYA